MDTQLDLSIAATIKDPDLRASLERLGTVMKDTPPRSEPEPQSSAKIIQFPLFPEATRPVSNDMARSALFSCIQGKDRRFIKDALMATVDGVEIRFAQFIAVCSASILAVELCIGALFSNQLRENRGHH